MLDAERRLLLDAAQSAQRDRVQQQKVAVLDDCSVASTMVGVRASYSPIVSSTFPTSSGNRSRSLSGGMVASGNQRLLRRTADPNIGLRLLGSHEQIQEFWAVGGDTMESSRITLPGSNSRTMIPGSNSRTMIPGSNSRTMIPDGDGDGDAGDGGSDLPAPGSTDCYIGCLDWCNDNSLLRRLHDADGNPMTCTDWCTNYCWPGGYSCPEYLVPPSSPGACFDEFGGTTSDCRVCLNPKETSEITTLWDDWSTRNLDRIFTTSPNLVSRRDREVVSAALSLLQDNWDLCDWVICWVYGKTSVVGSAWRGVARALSFGSLGVVVDAVTTAYSTVTPCMKSWVNAKEVITVNGLDGLVNTNIGVDGGDQGAGSSVPNVGVWIYAGNRHVHDAVNQVRNCLFDDSRMCALIALAAVLFHEASHQCGVSLGDWIWDGTDENCLRADSFKNSLRWALMQRYPLAYRTEICADEVDDQLFGQGEYLGFNQFRNDLCE